MSPFGIPDAHGEPQVLRCHYFNEDGHKAGDQFGGDFENNGDGTAKCTLDDSSKELSCMAVFQLMQDVDKSGNVTERMVIRSTGMYLQFRN